eukprot:13583-Hanusia_phi.AAC.5
MLLREAPKFQGRDKLIEKIVARPVEGNFWHADHIVPVSHVGVGFCDRGGDRGDDGEDDDDCRRCRISDDDVADGDDSDESSALTIKSSQVFSGGGECNVDNIRTLCIICHQSHTSKQASQRAESRRTTKDKQSERKEKRSTRKVKGGGETQSKEIVRRKKPGKQQLREETSCTDKNENQDNSRNVVIND